MKVALVLLPFLVGGCQDSNVSRELGAECTSDKDCDDVCADGGNYPDGMCTLHCETDDDCPSEAACVSDQGGICLYRCANNDQCTFLGTEWDCENSVCHGT